MTESEKLGVYLQNDFTGYLWLDDSRRFTFQYDPGYLKNPDAIPRSLSLPLREAPYIRAIISQYDGAKTIQKIYEILNRHIARIRSYL